MSFKPNDKYFHVFSTVNSSGIMTNADATPSGVANKNGADDTSFSLGVANLSTGRYVVSGTIPSYSNGDIVNIGVFATVGGTQNFANIDRFVIDNKRVGDLNDLGLSTTIASPQASGTLGGALLAAEAQGVGRWVLSGNTLTLYRYDGVTAVRVFTLDNASAPTQRS